MKFNVLTTKLNFMSRLSTKDITRLKKATADWIKATGWKPGSKNTYMIPWELIVVPNYQENRAHKSETNKSIATIVSEFDEDKLTPGLVNYRTDGPFAGLFMLNDGYHRARAMEEVAADMSYSGFLSVIINADTNKEIVLFATQYKNTQDIESITEYDALINSTDMSNSRVAAGHFVQDTLNKYHVNFAIRGQAHANNNYPLLAITECINIAERSLMKNDSNKFPWMIEILSKSNFALGKGNLNRSMFRAMNGLYDMIVQGRFDNLTPSDVTPVLVKHLKNYCWGSLTDSSMFAMDATPIQAKKISDITLARNLMTYWICRDFGLDTYGIYQDAA